MTEVLAFDIDVGNLKYDMFVKAYNGTNEYAGINVLSSKV